MCAQRKTIPRPNRRLGLTLYPAFLLTAALCGACHDPSRSSTDAAPARPGGGVDLGELERVEEQTEAFANAMLDLSGAIQAGASVEVERYFPLELEAVPFPSQPEAARTDAPGISKRHWPAETSPRKSGRDEVLASLDAFLDHWLALDEVRLKVKKSTVKPDGTIDASLALGIVGRNTDSRREWARATVSAVARKEGSSWVLQRFVVEPFDSLIADRDFFNEVSDPAGLAAIDPPLLEQPDELRIGLMAHGAAAADVDGDGLIDVFSAGRSGNALFVNQGDGTFKDVAKTVGIKAPANINGALFVDYDNDGDPDLFLSRIGTQILLENRRVPDGRLEFRDVSQASGVAREAHGFSVVAGDVNRDGRPDLYVASWGRMDVNRPDRWDGATNGTPNLLFLNRGDGTFQEVAQAWGVDDRHWTLAAQFADIDEDGKQDLFVANDFGAGTTLYLNQGDKFLPADKDRGLGEPGYGMGVSLGDYDNDGDLDLELTQMSSTAGRRILSRFPGDVPEQKKLELLASGSQLYENTGAGAFKNVTNTAGPFSGGWAYGGGFIDFDNDGWEDLHTPNGLFSGQSMHDT